MALYAIEIQREYKLSTYLRMNPEKPSDAITAKAAFESLTTERKNTIHSFDKLYQRAVIATIFIFAVNTLLSGYVIGTEYANDKGPILFATGTVLIASKIYNIVLLCHSEGYASAYLHTRSQFNDVKTSVPESKPI